MNRLIDFACKNDNKKIIIKMLLVKKSIFDFPEQSNTFYIQRSILDFAVKKGLCKESKKVF